MAWSARVSVCRHRLIAAALDTSFIRSLEEYDQEFRKIKKSRKLKFLPTKGSVRLNLEFQSRTLAIDVSPEAATLLSLFEGKGMAY